MHQPGLLPVDGEHRAAAPRVHRVVRPRRLARNERAQLRRPDVGGLHALDHRSAFELGADLFAHRRGAAVAADHEAGAQRPGAAAVEVERGGSHTVVVLLEGRYLRAIEQRHAPQPGRVFEQDRLQVDLVDAMRRLGGRPPGVGALGLRIAIPSARNRNAGELDAGHRGAEHHVVRVVGRQSGIAQLLRDAEPAELLHRARGDMVALHVGRLGVAAHLGDEHGHAARGQIHRHRQADRAGADDEHVGGQCFLGHVVVVRCCSLSCRGQSSLIWAVWMTLAHFAVSERM